MSAQWKQPTTIGLAEKLKEVNARLQELIPLLAKAQGEAVKRMAETAIAANQRADEDLK